MYFIFLYIIYIIYIDYIDIYPSTYVYAYISMYFAPKIKCISALSNLVILLL